MFSASQSIEPTVRASQASALPVSASHGSNAATASVLKATVFSAPQANNLAINVSEAWVLRANV